MNKKYLSALLLGTVLIASTGTFTSCKDYDDDIQNLQAQVDGLSANIQELQAAAGKYVTSVTYDEDTGVLTVVGGTGGTYQLPMPAHVPEYTLEIVGDQVILKADGEEVSSANLPEVDMPDIPEAFDPELLSWGADGYLYYGDVKVEGVEKPDAPASITEILDGTEVIGYIIDINGDKAVFYVKSKLTSLVFAPDFYWQGIEAMQAATYNYTEKALAEVDADGNYENDAPTVVGATSMSPGLVANYHMNPSNADWTKITELTYISEDKDYVRAAGPTVKANVVDWEGVNGTLTVHAQLTDGTLKDITDDEQVTVLALQAHYNDGDNDTIITSDYAAVKAVNYDDLVLAYSSSDPAGGLSGDLHLFTTAQNAINNDTRVVELEWNDEDGLDIAELVNTHYEFNGTHQAWDENANDGIVEKYGFKYSYELVGWHKGNNETSESAHAQLNGSIIRAQITSGGKQQPWGAEQSRATLDREPLVRVILTDVVSNKVAAVGYIKFKIVENAAPSQSEVVLSPEFTFNDPYTTNCTNDKIELKVTWHQVEEQILAELEKQGISKEEFHSDFKLDGFVDGVSDATQYDGILVSSVPTTKKGEVIQTTWDPADTETEVLHWELTNNEAYHIFKDNATVSVNVRYSKEVEPNVYQYVYITLTWTPSERNVTPAGALLDSDKINQYWYAENNGTAATGYSDIHANVEPVGQQGAADRFNSDILNTFVGNNVTVSNVEAVYTAFQDVNLTKTFVFADPQESPKLTPVSGNSGAKYNITVANGGLELRADLVSDPLDASQPVVRIVRGSVLEFQKSNYALDLLNNADHNELADGETFTAQIQINAANCADVDFTLDNNKFYAKFLRPVTVEDPHETNFVDATTGGSKADLILTFTDWRDHNFDDDAVTKNENYYEYYKVQAINFLGNDQILTDLNGTSGVFDHTLESITKNVRFDFIAPTAAEIQGGTLSPARDHYFGTLTYENNGTTTGDFKIRVPFEVVYEWGKIKVWVECNIQATEAN